MEKTILQTAQDIVQIRSRVSQIPDGDVDPYNEIMDILGDIFCYFVVADADKVADGLQLRRTHDDELFVDIFLDIVSYSSQPDHSRKLLRVLLGALNASTVNGLRCELLKLLVHGHVGPRCTRMEECNRRSPQKS